MRAIHPAYAYDADKEMHVLVLSCATAKTRQHECAMAMSSLHEVLDSWSQNAFVDVCLVYQNVSHIT